MMRGDSALDLSPAAPLYSIKTNAMKLNAVHVVESFPDRAPHGACRQSRPMRAGVNSFGFCNGIMRQDAGFSKLAAQLIELYADRFSTVAMRNLKGKGGDGRRGDVGTCMVPRFMSAMMIGGVAGARTDFESFSRNYVWGFNSLSEAAAAGRPDSRKEWEKLKQRDECSRSYLHEDAKVAIARAWKAFQSRLFP